MTGSERSPLSDPSPCFNPVVKEVVTVVTSLLVAGLSGGVFGALTGRKTAKDQLALEARKHQDELAAPKRTYQFDSLQAAVTALENAIVVTGSGM